ncbi:MAG: hypothetical protein R6W78_08885 [Bacteroidales bacterium]
MKKTLFFKGLITSFFLFIFVFQTYSQTKECLFFPPVQFLPLPDKGFDDLSGYVFDCEYSIELNWEKLMGKDYSLFVHADGPQGSGRLWSIIFGFSSGKEDIPDRGICLISSTTGWRTLRKYESPIFWATDIDKDGNPEIIIWDSFYLDSDMSINVETGIIAWVYKYTEGKGFELSIALSKKLISTILIAYNSEIEGADSILISRRLMAAAALRDFLNDKCTFPDRSAPK